MTGKRRGSALVFALWIIAVLSIMWKLPAKS